jgi:hypothetical protein
LNPKLIVNCNIQPKNNIFLDSIDVKSASVVTFQRQDFDQEF